MESRRTPAGTGARTAALLLALALGSYAAPPAPAATVPSAVVTAACTNQDVLAHWGVRRLVEQTVVVPVDENHVGDAVPQVAAGAGGVIPFGSRAPEDLRSRLTSLRSHAPGGLAPIVMTDEEGGSVQRMANLVGWVPSARHMGSTMSSRRIHRIALRLGRRMRAVGVRMDLAPVLDLDGRPGPDDADAIGTRSFSPRVRVATRAGLAFARGLHDGGVVPVVKHFPGWAVPTGTPT